MGQITVFSGVERRRRWDDDEKLAMVEASLVPGGSVARIARERDVAPSLIYKWRRRLCGAARVEPRGFAAVMISPGAIPLTRIPCGASATHSERVIASIAPFEVS